MLVINELNESNRVKWDINLAYLSNAIAGPQAQKIAAGFTTALKYVLENSGDSVGAAVRVLGDREM